MSASYTNPRHIPQNTAENGRHTGFIAVCFIIIVIAMITMPKLVLSDHAGLHTEADEIRQCNTIEAIFLNKSCERLNVIKVLDDGRVADHVIQYSKRQCAWLEITAYIPVYLGINSLDSVKQLMFAKGCTQVFP